MAGRRGVGRPRLRPHIKTDPITLGLGGQARLPEVFSIGTPDLSPDSTTRSPRPLSADQPRRGGQQNKVILGFKEEVKIPKRKKVQEPTPPPVETVLDQTPVDKDASVDSLAKVIVSEIITVVEERVAALDC
ncbi:hypothetical protein Pmar_PMAR015486 [Perkinsus marinus ATCC 50983]|uniref:Uncharacterized protein n=1 Tax=Perkinsus marinus (strain ATCC 50983 / TXsc) TaxID=423536 RepID=C5K5T1_PERM5|nr:hypothetical protein Pmar_PMAR015486 [Perkinsus marinus ATCC 50983]EER20163.1 hypothetical protein Pmar_PMAR015486 [Perkinsus marinus ATCC 50983]|eukprot:XP_002788367.1 hypothetical protein Pmar_PMAR015486 [Perkinsus marinus ATCC 50983]